MSNNKISKKLVLEGKDSLSPDDFESLVKAAVECAKTNPRVCARLVKLAEEKARHRNSMEAKELEMECETAKRAVSDIMHRNAHITRGQWIACALVIGGMILAYCFLVYGHPDAGATIATAAFAQLAAAFIFAPKSGPVHHKAFDTR